MTIAQNQPVPRPRHGCLFGCMVVLVILALPVIAVSAYSAWFIYQGFHNDPTLKAVSELMRHDGLAEQVLGENIHVTGIEGNAFSFSLGLGSHSAYSVDLTGSRASGSLAVESDVTNGQVHIDAMILTGPDGARYDLMHHTLAPGSAPTTSI